MKDFFLHIEIVQIILNTINRYPSFQLGIMKYIHGILWEKIVKAREEKASRENVMKVRKVQH